MYVLPFYDLFFHLAKKSLGYPGIELFLELSNRRARFLSKLTELVFYLNNLQRSESDTMNRREVSLSDDCPKHVWVAEGICLNKLCMLTDLLPPSTRLTSHPKAWRRIWALRASAYESLCSAASQLPDEALREMQRSMLARPQ